MYLCLYVCVFVYMYVDVHVYMYIIYVLYRPLWEYKQGHYHLSVCLCISYYLLSDCHST